MVAAPRPGPRPEADHHVVNDPGGHDGSLIFGCGAGLHSFVQAFTHDTIDNGEQYRIVVRQCANCEVDDVSAYNLNTLIMHTKETSDADPED